MIDAERVIGRYLRENDVERVVGKTPDDTGTGWVRLTQIDAEADHRADYLGAHYLQFDCYAGRDGGQPEANQTGYQVRRLLVDAHNRVLVGGTVTGVSVRGPSRVPDDDFKPARERTIVTATVWAHE